MSAGDAMELAEWWWEEAGRCQERGARGLASFCRDRAIYWTSKAARREVWEGSRYDEARP